MNSPKSTGRGLVGGKNLPPVTPRPNAHPVGTRGCVGGFCSPEPSNFCEVVWKDLGTLLNGMEQPGPDAPHFFAYLSLRKSFEEAYKVMGGTE